MDNNSGKSTSKYLDHLGTVRAVVSGEKTNGEANILSLTDYYPFGMDMPGRVFTGENYRFGYQDSERDRELMGGNAYTTFFRQLDPRLGRWMSPDPKVFPWQSSYVSMNNNPIALIDPWGANSIDPPKSGQLNDEGTATWGKNANTGEYEWVPVGSEAQIKLSISNETGSHAASSTSKYNNYGDKAMGNIGKVLDGATATRDVLSYADISSEVVDKTLEFAGVAMKVASQTRLMVKEANNDLELKDLNPLSLTGFDGIAEKALEISGHSDFPDIDPDFSQIDYITFRDFVNSINPG